MGDPVSTFQVRLLESIFTAYILPSSDPTKMWPSAILGEQRIGPLASKVQLIFPVRWDTEYSRLSSDPK